MTWFTANKDLVGILIATLALTISLLTVIGQRQQRRSEIFLRLNEMLIDPELQKGRRLLFVAMRSGNLGLDEAEFHLMNRALNAFDTAGACVRRRLVSRRWLLEMWHHSLRDIRPAAEAFTAHRQADHEHWRPWPDLWKLLDMADRFQCRLSCCPTGRVNAPKE